MRLLSSQVKRLIAVFTAITVGCLVMLGAAVVRVVGDRGEAYQISAGSGPSDPAIFNLLL